MLLPAVAVTGRTRRRAGPRDAPVTVRFVGIDDGLDRIPGLEWVRILAVDVAAPDGEPYPIIARATALRRPTSTSTTGRADRRTAPHRL